MNEEDIYYWSKVIQNMAKNLEIDRTFRGICPVDCGWVSLYNDAKTMSVRVDFKTSGEVVVGKLKYLEKSS